MREREGGEIDGGETDRDTPRETERQVRQRQTDRQTVRDRQRHTERDGQTDRQRQSQIDILERSWGVELSGGQSWLAGREYKPGHICRLAQTRRINKVLQESHRFKFTCPRLVLP